MLYRLIETRLTNDNVVTSDDAVARSIRVAKFRPEFFLISFILFYFIFLNLGLGFSMTL